MRKVRLLWQIFYNTLTISAFTFGGGYVMIPIIQQRFTEKLGWVERDEMLEFVALAQSSPGAIAINASVLAGWRVAGFLGALAALCGTVLPPLVILSVVYYFYELISGSVYVQAALRGMQAGIAAVIVNVVYGMAKPQTGKGKIFQQMLMLCAFAAAFFLRLNVIYIILSAALLGVLDNYISKRRGGNRA